MKKSSMIKAAVLTLVILSTVFISACGETKPLDVFAEIAREELEEYGELDMYWSGGDQFLTMAHGVMYIELIDFDNDGTEELIVAHRERGANIFTELVVEIWKYTDNSAECVYSGRGVAYDVDAVRVSILEKDGAHYLLTGGMDGTDDRILTCEDYSIYGLNGLKTEPVCEFATALDLFDHIVNENGRTWFELSSGEDFYSIIDMNLGYLMEEDSKEALVDAYNAGLEKLGLEEFAQYGLTSGPVTISACAGDLQVGISSAMFEQDNTVYHEDISLLSVALSGACYDGDDPAGDHLYNAFRALGFSDDDIFLYSYPGHENNRDIEGMISTDEDCAFGIASVRLMDTQLLVVAIRGTQSIGDTAKDASVGSSLRLGVRIHNGFYDFAADVMVGLSDYLQEHPEVERAREDGRLRVLFTGHSFGAAAANVVGAYYDAYAGEQMTDHIFVYTYATPRTYNTIEGDNPVCGKCPNIFNITGDSDPVTMLPADYRCVWKRFGTDISFSSDSYPYGSHDVEEYFAAVQDAARSAGLTPKPVPTPTPTPAVTPEPVWTASTSVCRAYLELLTAERDAIASYDWQSSSGETRAVVLADIAGDDTPELIYVEVDPSETWLSYLHIAAYIDGGVTEIYNSRWDCNAGGGFSYTLCRVQGEDGLYGYTSGGDEDWTTVYFTLEEGPNSLLQMKELYSRRTYDSGSRQVCMVGDTETDRSAYDSAAAAFVGTWSELLMNNTRGDTQTALIALNSCAAMTVDEAIAYLRGIIGEEDVTETERPAQTEAPAVNSVYSSWEDALRSFVLGSEYLDSSRYAQDYGSETDRLFGLHDLDGDGVPELIVYNGYSGRALRCAYCYGYEDGEVCYLGICPTEAYYLTGSSYTGLFGRYGDADEANWSYYSKNGVAVSSEPVCTTTGVRADGSLMSNPMQTTSDDGLFQAAQQELTYFNALYTEAEIRAMGWDAFAAA